MDDVPDSKLKEYRDAFDLFDKDKDGIVSYKEITNLMRSLNQDPTEDEINEIKEELELNGNGIIDFEEFIQLMNRRAKDTDAEDEIILAFKSFDFEGKGYIFSFELRHILITIDNQITEDEINLIINDADKQGSGKIYYEDFVRRMINK